MAKRSPFEARFVNTEDLRIYSYALTAGYFTADGSYVETEHREKTFDPPLFLPRLHRPPTK